MTCQSAIRLICEYLEGQLSAEVEHEIAAHLNTCHNCYQVFEVAEQTLETDFDADPRSLPHPHAA